MHDNDRDMCGRASCNTGKHHRCYNVHSTGYKRTPIRVLLPMKRTPFRVLLPMECTTDLRGKHNHVVVSGLRLRPTTLQPCHEKILPVVLPEIQ
jgi:hypothetical protein